MMATSKEPKQLYRIMAGRCLHFPEYFAREGRVWAMAGSVVQIDHPVLRDYLEGQTHKLIAIEKLEKGEKAIVVTHQKALREIQTYDRKADGLKAKTKAEEAARKEVRDKIGDTPEIHPE